MANRFWISDCQSEQANAKFQNLPLPKNFWSSPLCKFSSSLASANAYGLYRDTLGSVFLKKQEETGTEPYKVNTAKMCDELGSLPAVATAQWIMQYTRKAPTLCKK